MHITENELRDIVHHVLLKDSLFESLLLESNQDLLYEAVLNEISIRHQLLPIILSISPLFGCTKDDIKDRTVTPHTVAAAMAINNNPNTQLKDLSSNDQKIVTKHCRLVNIHSIQGFYINNQGQRVSAGPTINWKTCDDPIKVNHIIRAMTSQQDLEDAAESQLEKDVIDVENIEPYSPGNAKKCQIVEEEDGTKTVMYSPFCYNVPVDSLTPDEQSSFGKPYDPNMSQSEKKSMYKKYDSDQRSNDIENIKAIIKDHPFKNNPNMLKLKKQFSQRGQKNLLALYPQMTDLNTLWNNTNGSPEAQTKIDKFMKAVEKAYDKDIGPEGY
tara:strand:+ start:2181 stop:3164 length:984 start_codon:yes stop_codon:yes gene_type:complete